MRTIDQSPNATEPDDSVLDVSWGRLTLRVAWIAFRLVLVGALAAQGSYFFYQGF